MPTVPLLPHIQKSQHHLGKARQLLHAKRRDALWDVWSVSASRARSISIVAALMCALSSCSLAMHVCTCACMREGRVGRRGGSSSCAHTHARKTHVRLVCVCGRAWRTTLRFRSVSSRIPEAEPVAQWRPARARSELAGTSGRRGRSTGPHPPKKSHTMMVINGATPAARTHACTRAHTRTPTRTSTRIRASNNKRIRSPCCCRGNLVHDGSYQLFNGRYLACVIHRQGPHVGKTAGKHKTRTHATADGLIEGLHAAAKDAAATLHAARNKTEYGSSTNGSKTTPGEDAGANDAQEYQGCRRTAVRSHITTKDRRHHSRALTPA